MTDYHGFHFLATGKLNRYDDIVPFMNILSEAVSICVLSYYLLPTS